MRAHFPWSPQVGDDNPTVVPLTQRDAAGLHLPWHSRFSSRGLSDWLDVPGRLGLWVPDTGEYILGEPWRHRDEILQIVEVHGRRGKEAIVRALEDESRRLGNQLLILSDEVWNDQSRLFGGLGFTHKERIVFFQKDLKSPTALDLSRPLPEMEFSLASIDDIDLLLRLDHASFPWLWWNSATEFEVYVRMPDVYIYTATYEGEPAGYASFTMYGDWGHLDRLAVVEGLQGRRLGAAQLYYTLVKMHSLGAGTVGLSTQSTNAQSHVLYRGFGFKMGTDAMDFYGLDLGARR